MFANENRLSKGVETIDNIMFLGIFHSVYGTVSRFNHIEYC